MASLGEPGEGLQRVAILADSRLCSSPLPPCGGGAGGGGSLRSLLLALLLLLAAPAAALAQEAAQQAPQQQAEASSRIVYEREVFRYPRAGRPDPFRSLVGTGALGLRAEDLVLRGIMHDPDPRESVAILSVTGRERPVRARVGDRIGGVRILAIHPRRVDVLVEELGVARRESLHLRVTPEEGAQ